MICSWNCKSIDPGWLSFLVDLKSAQKYQLLSMTSWCGSMTGLGMFQQTMRCCFFTKKKMDPAEKMPQTRVRRQFSSSKEASSWCSLSFSLSVDGPRGVSSATTAPPSKESSDQRTTLSPWTSSCTYYVTSSTVGNVNVFQDPAGAEREESSRKWRRKNKVLLAILLLVLIVFIALWNKDLFTPRDEKWLFFSSLCWAS